MVFPYKDIEVDVSTFEFDDAPVDDMRLMIGALMDKYNVIGTVTGRFATDRFHIANTPKSGPSPSLRYVNGRLHVEGQHGPDVWAGTLDYADKTTTTIKLTLANRHGDGSYIIDLKKGTPFGFGDGMDTRTFGVFLGVDDSGSVAWMVSNDSPEHAVFCGIGVRDEKHEMRRAPMKFTHFGDREIRLSPAAEHDRNVRGMINVAMTRYKHELAEPLPMEPVASNGRPVGMYSSAHPHAFEVRAPRPNAERPFCDSRPSINLEVRRTKGGIERANFALKAMRMIATRARKGTPWTACGEGEPEALLTEYRLGLRVEDNSSGRLLSIWDKMYSHYDLHFGVCIQARTLAQMLDAIESIRDFT